MQRKLAPVGLRWASVVESDGVVTQLLLAERQPNGEFRWLGGHGRLLELDSSAIARLDGFHAEAFFVRSAPALFANGADPKPQQRELQFASGPTRMERRVTQRREPITGDCCPGNNCVLLEETLYVDDARLAQANIAVFDQNSGELLTAILPLPDGFRTLRLYTDRVLEAYATSPP